MNKYLLITGLGMLFLSNALSQQKLSQNLPDAVLIPFSAISPARSGHSILINHELLHSDNNVVGLTASGDTQFVSQYKHRRLHGGWRSWYHSQQLLDSGRLDRSVPDGEWRSWYPDGQLRSIRTYHATKLPAVSDEIRRRNSKSTFFVITDIAKNDLSAARRLLTPSYSFGSLHAVNSTAQLPEIHSLQDRVELNVAAGYYLPPFAACLHHGLYMNFFPDGAIKDSGYYKNGVRDGIWEEWTTGGSIRTTGFYKRGVKRGEWRHYNEAGKLLYVQLYNSRGRATNKIRLQ